jgi:hypothetical protein
VFPRLPLDPTASPDAALAGYAIAYAAVATCVVAIGASAPDLGRGAIVVVAGAALVLAVLSGRAPTALSAGIVLVCLLSAGTSAGAAIGARIESAGHILPVAVVSSIADAVSVLTPGAPSDVVVDTPALLSVLAISWPMPGTADTPAILGVGDIVFVALYCGVARRHALPLGRTLIALALGLALTAAVVALTSLAIPALPFIGGAMVLAHPEARRIPEKDRRSALVMLVLVVLAFGALVLARRSG